MKYNFHVFLIASLIIASPIAFLKNNILKDFGNTEEIIYVSFFILVIVSAIYFFYEKKTFPQLLQKVKTDKASLMMIYVPLIICTLLIGNHILINEGTVIRYKSYQRSLSIILMLIIGVVIFGEKVSYNMCIGVLMVSFGLYFIDKK